jgi:hypothetical protein
MCPRGQSVPQRRERAGGGGELLPGIPQRLDLGLGGRIGKGESDDHRLTHLAPPGDQRDI